MEKEILIDVNNVTRYYGNHCAVNDINFKLRRGEVVGFLGPNGAGKTTSMQMLSGVLAASEGQITIAGTDILDHPKQAKRHIGFLPESPPVYKDLTVDEYLRYAAKLRNIPSSEVKNAVEKSKQRCGLNEVGHRLIGNLSKGYQQRVGIAQAIVHLPAIVILDEPTSGLDPNQIVEIRNLIRELGKQHSVILSTHILPEVQTVCDRVIIIHQGSLVLDETLEELNNRKVTEYRIGLSNAPELSTMEQLDSISKIVQQNETSFNITTQDSDTSIDRFIEQAMKQHWGLRELVPINNSLEQTFIQLTHQSAAGTER